MKKKFNDDKLKEMYDIMVQCRDLYSARQIIIHMAHTCEISERYMRRKFNDWCVNNKLELPSKVIQKKISSELVKIISKDPSNIKKGIKEYVKKTYPELTVKGKEDEFETKFFAIKQYWYQKVSKNHTCFMTISSKGNSVINRKNSTVVNDTYEKSFLKNFKKQFVKFFKSIF